MRIFNSILPALVAFAALLCPPFAASAQTPYYSRAEMADLVRCLPAPPDTTDPAFAQDILRYMWGKTQRLDSVRASIAARDAVWSVDALLATFEGPFGLALSREGTPCIWRVMENSIATVDSIRIHPKAYFHRKRPFERFHEPMLTTWEEKELSGEGSYPSGHAMRGFLTSLLLAEINPAAADTLFARGWMYGESRVIAGAHWQSDVDASRVAAGIGYARLQTSACFRSQMEQAREEFRRLCGTAPESGREHFVSLAQALPDAILEIRYFSTYNFVGTRVDGYLAPTALLTREAADSLRAVSDDVMRLGYRLKIYDAYRPQMAVDHFVRWAADVSDTRMKPYFYPNVDKSLLFEQEYIMEKSGHTRGSTVDLTLVDMATGKDVDMGGTFDWFGIESHPDYCGNPDTGVYGPGTGISTRQFANRLLLREAMLRHGFKPLDSEWWHFTLAHEPFPDTYFNFPVW